MAKARGFRHVNLMNKLLIRSAVLGGIIVFLWGLVSWMLLPWHQVTIKQFQNEERVAQVIRENAFERGIYLLPNLFTYDSKQESGIAQQRIEEGRERVARGPVMFAAINPLGVNPNMAGSFFIAVIINIVGAYFISWIVLLIKTDYWGRVKLITLMGFIIGFLGLLPAWNWWNFALGYVAVGIIDLIIAWFLAGLMIAKIQSKKA